MGHAYWVVEALNLGDLPSAGAVYWLEEGAAFDEGLTPTRCFLGFQKVGWWRAFLRNPDRRQQDRGTVSQC